jgi:N-acetylglucosamine-6-phosphate deacetylase
MGDDLLIQGGRLVFEDGIVASGDLRVAQGRIVEVAPQIAVRAGERLVHAAGLYVAPGFLDLHIHGALGRDAMEATEEAFHTICRFHASGGTTGLALTTMTAPATEITAVLDRAAALGAGRHADGQWPDAARLLGVHVEGPYFSPQRPGAHPPHLLRLPRQEEWGAWLTKRGDCITQMTLAPELEGALELIAALREAGIIASAGHSDAWDDQAAAGHAHGVSQATHVFNAMSSQRKRGAYRVAGLLEYVLSEPGIQCEVIADGHHVAPTLLRMLYHAKGPDGVIAVTDASPGAGLPEGTTYRIGEVACRTADGVGLTETGEALAGSTATMIECVANLVRLAGVPLHEAVCMATLQPARALRIESDTGALRVGFRADFVIFDDAFRVHSTWVSGRAVYDASAGTGV